MPNCNIQDQEIPHLLFFWNAKVYYGLPNSPPLGLILSQINPVHSPISCFFKIISILSFHLCLSLPSDPLPSGFPTKIFYAFLISLMSDTFPYLSHPP